MSPSGTLAVGAARFAVPALIIRHRRWSTTPASINSRRADHLPPR
jgi:hypothetical protein